ncbi:MAG TPA: hypothetical protein DEP35_11410 [Deltaproteobacteria bacterium]|nr:hypothetical protein [Deltaproteobacteria bacterium]
MVESAPGPERRGGIMPKTLLLADDSVTIQKVVELTLSKEDFVLVRARSGEEAIRKAKEERPDLVLLDLVMPDLDFQRRLKKIKALEQD